MWPGAPAHRNSVLFMASCLPKPQSLTWSARPSLTSAQVRATPRFTALRVTSWSWQASETWGAKWRCGMWRNTSRCPNRRLQTPRSSPGVLMESTLSRQPALPGSGSVMAIRSGITLAQFCTSRTHQQGKNSGRWSGNRSYLEHSRRRRWSTRQLQVSSAPPKPSLRRPTGLPPCATNPRAAASNWWAHPRLKIHWLPVYSDPQLYSVYILTSSPSVHERPQFSVYIYIYILRVALTSRTLSPW